MAIAERVVDRDVERDDTPRPSRTIRTRTGRPARTKPVGTRAHGSAAGLARTTARAERIAATSPRPLVRATAGIEVDPHPPLRLVPRRRRAARFAGVVCALVVLTMLGAAAFQTQLARRQVQLDQLDQDIRSAREQYDQLRRERAELRSPSRLAGIASDIGMVAATQTEFIVMSPDVLAEVQESAGSLDPADGNESDPLQQFRAVKSITDGTP